jgi:acyl-CoA reductase-like NAD-dependent aldehyde dehydrogenase
MSESLKIISPIDGSVYAERPVARDADIEAAVSSARGALAEWKTVPVPERARYMLAFLDALLAMNDDVTVELAWQMGRQSRRYDRRHGRRRPDCRRQSRCTDQGEEPEALRSPAVRRHRGGCLSGYSGVRATHVVSAQ